MNIMEMKRALAKILMEKSYLEGDFLLSSGLRSDYYFDGRQTSLHPEGAWLIGRIFAQMIKDTGVRGLAGMTMGADPVITATSLAGREAGYFWPGLIVRKEAKKHGTASSIEGMGNVKAGDTVALLEDVVSTAGSVIKASESVRAAGLLAHDVYAILDREQGGREALEAAGLRLNAIFTRQEMLEHFKA